MRGDAVRGLARKNEVTLADVPADALELLRKAAYFPYWLFATVMTEYYDSPYGKGTRKTESRSLAKTLI